MDNDFLMQQVYIAIIGLGLGAMYGVYKYMKRKN